MAKGRVAHRSAVTGKFVKPGYAKQHPKTTVKERVPGGKSRKSK